MPPRLAQRPMRLLCHFGLHSPAPGEVWNRGFWFTSCARCGIGLVRTAAGRWHVPKGRKIVWKERTPRGRRPD